LTEKPWGEFKNLCVNQNNVTVKLITIKKGQRTSLQSHKNRDEEWIITNGYGIGYLGKNQCVLNVGNSMEIEKNQIHRMYAPTVDCTFIEISHGKFDEDDIIRFEDDYGRVDCITTSRAKP